MSLTINAADAPTDAPSHSRSPERRTLVRKPSKAETDPVQHRRRRRLIEIGLGVGVPVLLITLWQVASSSGWINARIYPSPSEIVAETRRAWQRGTLPDAIRVSAKRVFWGYLIGCSFGAFLGFVMASNRWIKAALEPLLSALYTVPKLAVLPLFLTIFGFGERPIVALIGVTVFFYVWITTVAAVVSVPDGYLDAAETFRANGWQRFRHVLLPCALPQMFVGFRMAVSVSVLVLVGVEFVVGSAGLGFIINQGRQLMLLSQAYMGIVVVAILGYLFAATVVFIGRRLSPWHPGSN